MSFTSVTAIRISSSRTGRTGTMTGQICTVRSIAYRTKPRRAHTVRSSNPSQDRILVTTQTIINPAIDTRRTGCVAGQTDGSVVVRVEPWFWDGAGRGDSSVEHGILVDGYKAHVDFWTLARQAGVVAIYLNAIVSLGVGLVSGLAHAHIR